MGRAFLLRPVLVPKFGICPSNRQAPEGHRNHIERYQRPPEMVSGLSLMPDWAQSRDQNDRRSACISACVFSSGNRPNPADKLSIACFVFVVSVITQFTAGLARMNFRENCAQLSQSKSAAQAGNSLSFTSGKYSPLIKGRLMITATPLSRARGSSRSPDSGSRSE